MASLSNGFCVRCNQPEDKQNNPAFQCKSCSKVIHLSCFTNPPSSLIGDVLYELTCSTCSSSNTDIFIRNKMTWVYVLILTINHLHWTSQGISNRGFFHYKTHVACFIDRNWTTLFGPHFKQKKNWVGTLVGALSCYSGCVFQSSSSVIGDQGWWRLMYRFSPALAVQIIQEMAKDKAVLAKAKRNKISTTNLGTRTVEQILNELGHGYLLIEKEIAKNANPTHYSELNETENSSNSVPTSAYQENDSQEMAVPFYKIMINPAQTAYEKSLPSRDNYDVTEDVVFKKMRMDPVDNVAQHTFQHFDNENKNSHISYDHADMRTMSFPFEKYETPNVKSAAVLMDSRHGQNIINYESDSKSRSPISEYQDESETGYQGCKEKPEVLKIEPNKFSLFSTEPNSIDLLPWFRTIDKPDKTLMRLTEYEEIHLLKRIEAMIPEVKNYTDRTYLRRLRAKLTVRRLKRNKHLPLFDLDNTVKYLAGYSTEDSRLTDISKERVLDRFQSSYMHDGTGAIPATLLVSCSDETSFQSPHSGTILKPYIRRDSESRPLWLQLMDELLTKANKNNPGFVLPRRATIDYSYVRPHHISAVNNLCSQFFWPGVDVSESLQYPEFSCVVTYKKLLIGFALLVPDAGPNTAYISFILTRPEWRRSHVATFMLYHLLQTCTGRDVTLHVSPTNPAVFLYQKFGFKVEELVQDFYEKYFDVSSKVCKHALFLRLTR